jgi:F0F1-type ATP synthase membrane subunit c/vacuolar-type H+-ATPase subunit K
MAMSQTGSIRIWLLLAAGLMVLAAVAAGGMGYVVVRSIRSSGAYQKAVEELRRHPAVGEALGEPIAEGWLPTGSVNVTGPAGEAKLAIPVRGSKGQGTLYLEAVKRADEWEMTLLQLQPPSGARIDCWRVPSTGRSFEAAKAERPPIATRSLSRSP